MTVSVIVMVLSPAQTNEALEFCQKGFIVSNESLLPKPKEGEASDGAHHSAQ